MAPFRHILLTLAVFLAAPATASAEPPAWYTADIQADLPPQSARPDDLVLPTTGQPADQQGSEGEPIDDLPDTGADDPHENNTNAPPADPPPSDDPIPDGPTEEPADETFDEPADEPTDETFDETLDDNVDEFERVGITGPRPPDIQSDPPQWWKDFIDWLADFDSPDVDLIAILKVLGWGALALLVLAIAGAIFRVFRKFELPATPAESSSAIEALRRLTQEQPHDIHASLGAFDIAIHALLLDALVQLARKHPIVEAPSTTSREVAQNLEPTPGPLSALVQLSEAAIFALVPATQAHYEHARALHAQILEGLT